VRRLTSCHLAGSVSRTANTSNTSSTVSSTQGSTQSRAAPINSSGVETMSTTHHLGRATAAPPLRVRDQAREVAALIAFSAATASCLAFAILFLIHLGQQG
jgi:hypothetical protein